MGIQKKVPGQKSKENQAREKRPLVSEQLLNLSPQGQWFDHQIPFEVEKTFEDQSSLLADRHLFAPQRQSIAMRIGAVQGNLYLQRVLGKVIQRQEEPEPAPQAESTPAKPTNNDQQISDAIHNALQQYQEMPINVPATDPRKRGEQGGEPERVLVRIPYFLNSGGRQAKAVAARKKSAAVRSALSGIPLTTSVGKGSPADIRQLVQNSINRGIIRPSGAKKWPPSAKDIRTWMETYGIGIDCTGFVYWALWQVQASRGGTTAAETWAAQFKSGGVTRRGWPDLFLKGAQKIESPTQLRPGDIAQREVKGSIGHYRIVMDTKVEGEYFYFTLAESAGSTKGPNTREFRVKTGATSFNEIEEKSKDKWKKASKSNRQYVFWRRPETASASPEGTQEAEEEGGESQPQTEEGLTAADTPGLSPASLPTIEQVYGTEEGTTSGTPQGIAEQQGAPEESIVA